MSILEEIKDIARVLFTPLPKPVEIPANLRRVESIPYSLLPDMSPARDVLIALAWRGCDVDAYQAAGTHEWVIWCKPGEGMTGDGRYTVEQWKAVADSEAARLLRPIWDKEEAS